MGEGLDGETPMGSLAAVGKIISPTYRTAFILVVGLACAVVGVLMGFTKFQDWVDNRAKTTWQADSDVQDWVDTRAKQVWNDTAIKAQDDHKSYELELKDHNERIGTLEKSAQAQHDLLIEINTNVKNQSESISEIKQSMKGISRAAR